MRFTFPHRRHVVPKSWQHLRITYWTAGADADPRISAGMTIRSSYAKPLPCWPTLNPPSNAGYGWTILVQSMLHCWFHVRPANFGDAHWR